MYTDFDHQRAAEMLVASRLGDALLDSLPEEVTPRTIADAYEIQDRVHDLLIARGRGRLVGAKIGCTTPVMQAYLGIDQPCAGGIFSSQLAHRAGYFVSRGERRLGVECEIAVTMGADLYGTVARPEVAAAVGSYHASIEVVEDRYRDYPSLPSETLIADDFFHAGLVLGPAVTEFDPDQLANVRGRMLVNGIEVGSGVGSDVMDHPLDALRWLVASRQERGRGLRVGDVVTLGSLVQTQWVEPGDEVVVENDRLGTVRAVFGQPGHANGRAG